METERETYKPVGRCFLYSFANFLHRLAHGELPKPLISENI